MVLAGTAHARCAGETGCTLHGAIALAPDPNSEPKPEERKRKKEKEAEIPKTLLNWLGVTPGSEVWQAFLNGHQK
jgi:hypothetical protein